MLHSKCVNVESVEVGMLIVKCCRDGWLGIADENGIVADFIVL